MWKKSRANKQGEYDNDDVQQVVHKIDEISMNTDSSSVNRHYSNDVLTQAFGTKEHNGGVRGVSGYVIPTTYFHSVKKVSKDEVNILLENEEPRRRGIEEKSRRVEVESMDKPKENEKKGKEVVQINEPKFEVFKSILRYAEKVMEKDSSITLPLPADIFGISRKSSVLQENIIDLCNMNEVKTFTLVAYMMYLYSSVLGSKENVQYVFVDPSLISSGSTQEPQIQNLCSRLMVSKANQVVLTPFNSGGHWALLAINAYEDTLFYLDSLRMTSRATTRYVIDT
ncbi:putative serine/threonine-protein kinase nek2 [Cucumis melo var. makuwa]|uniref:Serine/threonine-protein kinase nek2 n=1 Tax=Cucumis melo var. makuwa TaxID=1194695 RepID=A0A5A7TCJ9_CUCMM|nr:putative serine/threonine-protein kinase nek2 [Cucumis melo var. makuwa]